MTPAAAVTRAQRSQDRLVELLRETDKVRADRRQAVRELSVDHSYGAIALLLGVSRSAVQKILT